MTPKWATEIIHTCLNVRENERFLIFADEPLTDTVNILSAEARTVKPAQVQTYIIPNTLRPLSAIPDDLPPLITDADVILAMIASFRSENEIRTLMALRPLVSEGRIRFAIAVGVTPEILDNELSADYTRIAATTLHIAEQLQGTSQIHVITELGTDLTMRVDGRRWLTDTGLSRGPGIGNLPAGEVFIAPLEDSANGVLLIDGTIHMGSVDTPVRVTFENGHAVKIEGGESARLLESLIALSDGQPGSEWARVIGEFGIGTNDKATLRGSASTDEKVMGTIHVAIGRNDMFGGQNTAVMHIDGVVTRPTVQVDGRVILEDGRLLIAE